MDHSQDLKELSTALVAAQGEIKAALKLSDNPFYKSKYADLATVTEAYRDIFCKHGLSVVAGGEQSDGEVCHVTVMMMHTSGQWISGTFSAKPAKLDPQGIGSCITYLRRYGTAAMTGVVTEDDDGNAASHPTPAPSKPKSEKPNVTEGGKVDHTRADGTDPKTALMKRLYTALMHEVDGKPFYTSAQQEIRKQMAGKKSTVAELTEYVEKIEGEVQRGEKL